MNTYDESILAKKIKKLKKNLQDPENIKKAYHKQLSKNYVNSQNKKHKMSKESIDKWNKLDYDLMKTRGDIIAKYDDNPSERDRLLKQNSLKHRILVKRLKKDMDIDDKWDKLDYELMKTRGDIIAKYDDNPSERDRLLNQNSLKHRILVKRLKKGKHIDDKYLTFKSPAQYVKNSANDVILNLYDLYCIEGVIDESDLEAYIMFINESEDYDDFMDRVYFIESELN